MIVLRKDLEITLKIAGNYFKQVYPIYEPDEVANIKQLMVGKRNVVLESGDMVVKLPVGYMLVANENRFNVSIGLRGNKCKNEIDFITVDTDFFVKQSFLPEVIPPKVQGELLGAMIAEVYGEHQNVMLTEIIKCIHTTVLPSESPLRYLMDEKHEPTNTLYGSGSWATRIPNQPEIRLEITDGVATLNLFGKEYS